jgi:hypothetical protein
MRRAPGCIALLFLLCGATELLAQAPILPVPPRAVIGRSLRVPVRVRSSWSLYLRSYGVGYYSPYVYMPGYGSLGWYRPSSSVTIVYAPIVMAAPAAEPAADDPPMREPIIADPTIIRPRQPEPRELVDKPEPPLPGVDAGRFRPVDPADRARAAQPIPPEQPAPDGKPKPPPPKPLLPDPDPKTEYARLIALGHDAFTAQEYARAGRRFQQATQVLPKEHLAYFLLAQAKFALGKYREAVAAIHAGVQLRPDWPLERFRPVTLYGDNVAEYPQHLKQLENTLSNHPDDPVLLFLFGYQLWFDGKPNEARPYFRQAAATAADPEVIQRFLKAQPGALVVGK